MPLHYLCSLEISKGVIEVINRARRHCLWRKKKEDGKINSLASWDMICKPKVKGGLGIINLELQNKCLLMKHQHKLYNNEDLPWVKLVRDAYYYNEVPHNVTVCGSFWWRTLISFASVQIAVSCCF